MFLIGGIYGTINYIYSWDFYITWNFYSTVYKKAIKEMENQQKEFIELLEKMWKETQDIWYIKILQKYKEIIGDKQ